LGFAEVGASEFGPAEQALAQARQKAPDDPGTRALAAYLALQRRQFRLALAEVEPLDQGKKGVEAWLRFSAAVRAEARHELGEVVDPDTEPLRHEDNFSTRTWLRLEQDKDVTAALADVNRKLQEKPRKVFWKFLRAVALLKAGQTKEALGVLEGM